jgi:predicted HicB family RNase H-like nuclease
MTKYLLKMPVWLHRALKILAAEEGKSMQGLIVEVLIKFVNSR